MESYSLSKRLNDLSPDETLFDFMMSKLDFYVRSSHSTINKHLLDGIGIEKGKFISTLLRNLGKTVHISYQDTECKSEMLYDLIIQSIIPEKWWNDVAIKQCDYNSDEEGNEVVLIDIKGNFSTEKLKNKLTKFYEVLLKKWMQQFPKEILSSLKSFSKPGAPMSKKMSLLQANLNLEIDESAHILSHNLIEDDLAIFIQTCWSSLYVLRVFSVEDFTTVSRSMPKFLKTHRRVRLLLIDGLHNLPHREFKNEEKKSENIVMGSQDFFDIKIVPEKETYPTRAYNKSSKPKGYEKLVMEAGLQLLTSLQDNYKFCLVTFAAKFYIRKVFELQRDILSSGLSEGEEPRFINNKEDNTFEITGSITTEDENLRRAIRELIDNEILILKWDEDNSLDLRNTDRTQERLDTQIFSCYIIKSPQADRDSGIMKKAMKNRYLSLFVLYKNDEGFVTESDSIVKEFII